MKIILDSNTLTPGLWVATFLEHYEKDSERGYLQEKHENDASARKVSLLLNIGDYKSSFGELTTSLGRHIGDENDDF